MEKVLGVLIWGFWPFGLYFWVWVLSMYLEVIMEVREASPAHYLLKIESFSLLSESGIDKFESNEFESGGYKWKMIIYPNGNTRENGNGHISVYLAMSGTDSLPAGWEVNAIFTFFMFNQLRDNYLSVREVTMEIRDVSPAHYLLKIESFSLLSESGIETFESNEFEACGYKWKMIIYPRGNTRENGSGHISAYLAISGTSSLPAGWEVNAIFTFFILNQLRDNYLSVRGKMRRFQSVKSLWGLAKFLSHDTLKEASNGYLIDDKCVVGAEIFVVQKQAIGECLAMVKPNDSFKREWKICNFSNLGEDWLSEEFTVGDHKWKLWLCPKGNVNNKGCDISIFLKCVDAKDFNEHQKVKANCSINLKDQINGECKKLSYCTWFSNTRQNFVYPGFMPLTQLHDHEKGYVVNDCIVVEVELNVEFKHSVKSLS